MSNRWFINADYNCIWMNVALNFFHQIVSNIHFLSNLALEVTEFAIREKIILKSLSTICFAAT